jgi:multiple sugar transport system substrate-binding protein
MNRSLKLLALFIVVLALVLTTMAVPSGTRAQEAVKLSFWSRDSDEGLVRGLVNAWNASHKNQIEVTIIPAADFVTKVGTAVAGGAAPDIMAIDLIYVPAFAAADQLTEIGDLAKALPFFDKLSPSHVRLATYKDKLYALPFNAEASVLMWNKGLFKQAGLDPEKGPTNWDEIYTDAKKITALGNGIYGYYFSGACAGCNAFTFAPLIWASGGDFLSEDYSTPTLTDPNVKAALEFYRKMWVEKLMPEGAKVDNGSDFFNAFQTNKIGMIGTGAFAQSVLRTNHPEIEFGVTYLPGQKGGKSSFAGGDSVAIPKGSKYVKEAFEFIQWALSDDVQLEQFAKTSQLPVRTDLAKNKYFDADPRLELNADAMALGRTPYSLKYNELFNDANGPWLAMLQTAIFDGKVDEAIATAQQAFTQIMTSK